MSCSKVKGPNEVLDYEEDWSDVLAASSPADTISTSTWTATNGVIVDSDTNTPSVATVWLSGGRVWSYATVTNTIVTAGARTFVRKMTLEIRPK